AGLEGGGEVLRGVAGRVTQKLEGTGLVGRFGGEQFAILLPQTGETEARRLAERLRDHIAGEPIAIENGSHAGFVFRLTVSIGIAVLDRSRRALTELIGAADRALSEAKTTGRNKVCVLPGVPEPAGQRRQARGRGGGRPRQRHAGPGQGASDGAAPLDQDHVAPPAVQVADPLADAHRAEALLLVQAEAGGVLREDGGLDGPDPRGPGGGRQGLGPAPAPAPPRWRRRHAPP